jgi:hypothetical protein
MIVAKLTAARGLRASHVTAAQASPVSGFSSSMTMDIVALVAYHLVKAGYRVSTACTGPDALGGAAGTPARSCST